MKNSRRIFLSPVFSSDFKCFWKTPFNEDFSFDLFATRQGFGKGLSLVRRKDVVALSADLAGSTGMSDFIKKFPERFFTVGVAEQCLAGVAAGFSLNGFFPFFSSFACFSPGRNWDFIRSQIVMSNLNCVIVGSHAGLATGPDGATHQALEDVSLLRSLPNIVILSPADFTESKACVDYSLSLKKPVYLRLVREKFPVLFKEKDFSVKNRCLISGGRDAHIFSTGVTLFEVLKAAKLLFQTANISVRVTHIPIIKPFDVSLLTKFSDIKNVFSVEDHSIIGGLGSVLSEIIAEKNLPIKLTRFGVIDSFGLSGSKDVLYKKYGIDYFSIAKGVASSLLSKKDFVSWLKRVKKFGK